MQGVMSRDSIQQMLLEDPTKESEEVPQKLDDDGEEEESYEDELEETKEGE